MLPYILKIWWKLLTWLLIRREAKNIFTKVFRLVSAELSIYTVFTNNCIYGLLYIIICYRIPVYIEKRQDIRSTAAPVRSKSQTGVWDPIHGYLGSQARQGMNPRLSSERMNPRRESAGMETTTG